MFVMFQNSNQVFHRCEYVISVLWVSISLRKKFFVFGVFLFHIFSHSDWIRRDTLYLSVFSPNAEKYGPEKLRIGTFFMQCITNIKTNNRKEICTSYRKACNITNTLWVFFIFYDLSLKYLGEWNNNKMWEIEAAVQECSYKK